MKERPILFSGAMVRAILDGKKTQTRRVVKPQPTNAPGAPNLQAWFESMDDGLVVCPYGQPGDRLWVRETWNCIDTGRLTQRQDWVRYRATDGEEMRWRPSIFMPRWASRATLEVTGVRVERVQDISEQDARAEGVAPYRLAWWDGFIRLNDQRMHVQRFVTDLDAPGDPPADMEHAELQRYERPACEEFRSLWDSINAKRGYGWECNPWVWVVAFREVAP